LRPKAVWFVAAALVAAGCGGDDEQATDTAQRTETAARTETEAPQATVTAPGPRPEATVPGESPEDQPGGAGDEIPARSLAMFTGYAGRITPKVVRVPPFISIRVELRSADRKPYSLRFGDRSILTGTKVASASTVLPGLRPGDAYRGRNAGVGNPVRIEATAEPGP
jgi:hypothetical protein